LNSRNFICDAWHGPKDIFLEQELEKLELGSNWNPGNDQEAKEMEERGEL
jgi:hypothetical protein